MERHKWKKDAMRYTGTTAPHAGHLNSWKLLEILYPRTGVDFPRQHIYFHSMRAEFQQAEAKINNYTKEERRQRLTGPEST
jgi:hypothetical protein